jgi:transcriptional regulator with XRE-family HTH domain
MILSAKLVTARKIKDISQKDMAAKLGISVASLNRYEGGIREIDLNVLKNLAALTEKPVEWFFDESINNSGKEEEMAYRDKYETLMEKYIAMMEENSILKEELLKKAPLPTKKLS